MSTTEIAPTPRQMEIRAFIADYWARHGFAPTVRDIGLKLGIKSPNGVMCHLKPLRDRGLVTWVEGKGRTLRVTGDVT